MMREQFTHINTKLLYHGANTELLELSKQISVLPSSNKAFDEK